MAGPRRSVEREERKKQMDEARSAAEEDADDPRAQVQVQRRYEGHHGIGRDDVLGLTRRVARLLRCSAGAGQDSGCLGEDE